MFYELQYLLPQTQIDPSNVWRLDSNEKFWAETSAGKTEARRRGGEEEGRREVGSITFLIIGNKYIIQTINVFLLDVTSE